MSAGQGLNGLRIVLGVSGGIAAYKAADLTSKLVQAGATVDVVMTESAQAFIRPQTFNALTRRPVLGRLDEPWTSESAGHVTIAAEANLVVIAPATANTIARLAMGLVDDMLSAVVLATQATVVVAPAMEHHMWHHPATRRNLAMLRDRGVIVIEPESGRLASGATGDGRLASTDAIVAQLRTLTSDGPLTGRHIVVTAGGTKEAIDPVRYIGNRSSGRMGVEIARVAAAAGAAVTLIAAEDVEVPYRGIAVQRIVSARDLNAAVHESVVGADALIMAAAVADFRPVNEATQKIKKRPGQHEMSIELTRNPDIIAGIDQPGLLKIGFAAETEQLIDHATIKLSEKGLAMIVANDAVATIGSLDTEATLLFPDRESVTISKASKQVVADQIVFHLTLLLGKRSA